MAKNKSAFSGIVFSTDPDFKAFKEELPAIIDIPPDQQQLIIRFEAKHRAGKAVTVIEKFEGSAEKMGEIAKKLKSYCGTGGTVKDGIILIQGNNVDKVLKWLKNSGYSKTKRVN